jgi:hypothetical protein
MVIEKDLEPPCRVRIMRYTLMLLAMVALLPFQACDIAYVSRIRINERSPNSVDSTENETAIRSTFEGLCSKKGFSAPWG